jgi:large subunit ribosomal protein L23
MAILDVFKKKEGEKAVAEVKTKKKEAKKAPKVQVEEKPKVEKKVEKKVKKTSAVYDILKEPYITEKGTDLSKENKYVFKVYNNANKMDIKKAIESLYNVNVISVRTVNIPRKKKRFGRRIGFKAGLRKAIIQIKEGQKIEIIAN